MSTLLGMIDEFDESMDHFFAANGIDDADRKKSTFLAVIGLTTYTLLRNLVSPSKPGDKSYDQLVLVLKDHFNPTPSATVQRAHISQPLQETRGNSGYICR